MLILVVLFSLVRLLQGVPITNTCHMHDSDLNSHTLLQNSRLASANRKPSEIITSCFATIIACAWTAIHPNIPAPTDSQWVHLKRRCVMSIYALLAPELILYWAITQRVAAKQIARQYNKDILNIKTVPRSSVADRLRKSITFIPRTFREWFTQPPLPGQGTPMQWTITHGFFLQMGGFMLCDQGMPIQTLLYDGTYGLHYLIKHNIIDAPTITEADIKGRSKGDSISKTVVILQTSWFIVQCISRWSTGLPVTLLEVVTLAFALLNGITYFVWWNKPQNVRALIYLEKIRRPQGDVTGTSGQERHDNGQILYWHHEATDEHRNSDAPEATSPPKKRDSPCQRVAQYLSQKNVPPWKIWTLICPIVLFQTHARPLSKMANKPTGVAEGALRVPMFYAGNGKHDQHQDSVIFTISMLIGVLFGSVHLIPSWFLDFPSLSTLWLWRASAFVITGIPIISLAGSILTSNMNTWDVNEIRVPAMQTTKHEVGTMLLALSFLASPIYICARLTLLVAAFLSFRNLSQSTLLTIDWLSLIPHL